MAKRRSMSSFRRQVMSRSAKAKWASRSDEERDALLAKGRAAYAAKYPERAALSDSVRQRIASGDLVPEPCDTCGGPSQPVFDWTLMQLVAWRCFPCRKGDQAGLRVAR